MAKDDDDKAAAAKAAADKAAADKAAADAKAAEAELGDAGKRALDAMREDEKLAKTKAKDEGKRADAAEKALADLVAEGATDQEKELVAARAEAADEAEKATKATYQQRILETEVLAAATGKLTTPSDAVQLLLVAGHEFDADSDGLRTSLGKAIDALVKEKPYLRSGKVEGEGDGGAKPLANADDAKLTPSQRLAAGYEANEQKKKSA